MPALAIAAFWVALFGAGSLLTRRLPAIDDRSRVPVAVGLGYGAVGELLFMLASAGRLRAGTVGFLLAIAFIAGLLSLHRLAGVVRTVADPTMILLIVGLVPSFLLGLYPPAGYDAVGYHLPFAKLFAETGRLAVGETLRFPLFPQLGEIIFAAGLLLAGDVAAQLTQWLAMVVTAATILAIGQELDRPRAGRIALAAWFGLPIVIYLGSNAYIEMTLTMSVTLAFHSWLVWRRTGSTGWIVVCACFAAMAAATKYHGLMFATMLALAVPFASRKNARLGTTAAVLVVIAAIAFPWYAHIYSETGNPLYPFFTSAFGPNDFAGAIEPRIKGVVEEPSELATSIVSLPARALALFIRGEIRPSPLLPALLPLVLAGAIVEPRIRGMLVVCLVYIVVIAPLGQHRFLMPVLPLLCVSIGCGLERLWSLVAARSRRPLEVIALALLIGPGLAWAANLIHRWGPIPHDEAARSAFLASRLPAYEALAYVERVIPPTDREGIYVADASDAMYYCPGRCMGDWFGPYRFSKVVPLVNQPEQLRQRLNEFGAEVLVIDPRKHDLEQVRNSAAFRLVFRSPGMEAFLVEWKG